MSDSHNLHKPPLGFEVHETSSNSSISITYKSHGMKHLSVFLIAVPTIIIVAFIIYAICSPSGIKEFLSAAWWVPISAACGILAFVFCLSSAIFNLFGRTTFNGSERELTINRKCWFFSSSKKVAIPDIKRFIQIKDGGEGEDTFPSWGLLVAGTKKTHLLWRQPLEKSDWLGDVLAHHYKVPYLKAKLRN